MSHLTRPMRFYCWKGIYLLFFFLKKEKTSFRLWRRCDWTTVIRMQLHLARTYHYVQAFPFAFIYISFLHVDVSFLLRLLEGWDINTATCMSKWFLHLFATEKYLFNLLPNGSSSACVGNYGSYITNIWFGSNKIKWSFSVGRCFQQSICFQMTYRRASLALFSMFEKSLWLFRGEEREKMVYHSNVWFRFSNNSHKFCRRTSALRSDFFASIVVKTIPHAVCISYVHIFTMSVVACAALQCANENCCMHTSTESSHWRCCLWQFLKYSLSF